jgi:putative FmdB family regulatory protein
MPIFEFRCSGCGSEFEHLALGSSPAPRCPSCGGADLEKLISLSAVRSEQSRERAIRAARKRAEGVRYDKEHEEHKDAHEHIGEEH